MRPISLLRTGTGPCAGVCAMAGQGAIAPAGPVSHTTTAIPSRTSFYEVTA